MADIRAIKPDVSGKVASLMRAAVEEAIASGATGFLLVTETPSDFQMSAHIRAPRIREYIGFWHSDAEPKLRQILHG